MPYNNQPAEDRDILTIKALACELAKAERTGCNVMLVKIAGDYGLRSYHDMSRGEAKEAINDLHNRLIK